MNGRSPVQILVAHCCDALQRSYASATENEVSFVHCSSPHLLPGHVEVRLHVSVYGSYTDVLVQLDGELTSVLGEVPGWIVLDQ